MTAKEKAKYLYDKIHFALPSYHDEGQQEHQAAKACAQIAADEAINIYSHIYEHLVNEGVVKDQVEETATYLYWEQVKKEIESL